MAKSIYDIHDCYVEFVEGNNGKVRPVLILDWCTIEPDKVYFYKITSQYSNKPEHIRKGYFPIKHWQHANLTRPSYVDIYELQFLSVDEFTANQGHHRGSLHSDDIRDFGAFLQQRHQEAGKASAS